MGESAVLYVFCVLPRDGISRERYWLLAGSDSEARHLVALSVEEAAGAENVEMFDCVPDGTKNPLPGFIHSLNHGPVAIKQR
jgi:hypothetical protein